MDMEEEAGDAQHRARNHKRNEGRRDGKQEHKITGSLILGRVA
jgi:hypothetical protein